jgi:hypothetical protein
MVKQLAQQWDPLFYNYEIKRLTRMVLPWFNKLNTS